MGHGLISSIHILGILMEVQEGCKGQRRVHNFICSLGEIERELWHEVCCMRRGKLGRILSWREASSLEPCFIYWGASSVEKGALVEEGASAVGRSYTCQIVVGSVSKGGHTPVLDYYGGVFHSELTVCICSRFSGFGSIYEGHTFLGRTCFIWTCVSAWIKLLLYQFHLYFVLSIFHHLFSS